ncbi:tyrosine-type recombinase/integrase [Shewanella sp. GD03713]|uniref:tyrosine-type recombinase/integrase n=1 Tax=Shewanella sp. GD03713 TaxID=2975372 RepID=UPI0024491D2F|nr:tyrosine-type recombinase/integrase [Shewanella sp. GD03713]MDH1472141.1 tyrosine-type recombinase/integrase [Shewanella sp. GD03713]
MRHLQRRNGVFYFRYRLPRHLAVIVGKAEIKHSLLTTSEEIAIGLIAPKLALLRRIKLMSSVANKQILLDLFAELTDYGFVDNLTEYQREEEREFATAWEVAQSEIGDSLKNGGHSFDPSDFGIKTPYPSDIKDKRDYQQLMFHLAGAMRELIINGRSQQFKEEFSSAKSCLDELLSSGEAVKQVAVSAAPKVLMLSDAIKMYLDWKSETSHKPKKQMERHADIMLNVLGDRNIYDIRKADIKQLLKRYEAFPKGNTGDFTKMSIKQIMDYDVDLIDEEDRVSSKTVKELFKFCGSLFNSFLVEEMDLLEKSPTDGIVYKVKSKSYSNFSNNQILSIIKAVSKEEGWKKWAVLISIYTGARRGDIANLRTDSLKYDDKTGRPYLWIEEGKTDAAQRAIPISRALEELGIIQFIKSAKDDVFPKLKANRNLFTDYFKSVVKSLGIPDKNDAGERYSLHGLRHTFITKAFEKGCMREQVQSVIGHVITANGDITTRYTHKFQVSALFGVVDAIDFD